VPINETILTPAVYDQLRQAMVADPEGFVALYRDYLAGAWEALQCLGEHIHQNHFGPVQAKAHYLKSSSLVLGAHDVARRASLVEQAAIAGNLKDAGSLLDNMRQALRDVQSELASRLGANVIPPNEAAA